MARTPKSVPTIVEPSNRKMPRRHARWYTFEVISESRISEIYVNWVSEEQVEISVQKSERPDQDAENYKMLCLGCFRKESNFFNELRKAMKERGVDIVFDDSSSNFKLQFIIDFNEYEKEYDFFRVTDDGAQVNIRDFRYKPKKVQKNTD